MGCVCVRMCAQSLSCVQFFATLWTVAHQTPLFMGFFQARTLEWVVLERLRLTAEFVTLKT